MIFPAAVQLSVMLAVPSALQTILGALRSFWIICCTQVAVLPQASLAVHVRVITVMQFLVSVLSLAVTVAEPHASVAVAEPTPAASDAIEALQFITTSGAQVITGGVISLTVMV
jgi:hypothetical protein